MTYKEMAVKEIDSIPEPLIEEVLDYIEFVKQKKIKQKNETAIASETVLKKDWLLPAEDEAWADL